MGSLFQNIFASSNFRFAPAGNFSNTSLMQHIGMKSETGVYVDGETAKGFSAFYASVRAIAESIAMIPKEIYAVDGTKKDLITDHASNRMLDLEANDLMTSFTFFQTLLSHALITGNGYAELQMESGGTRVSKMWLLPPGKVQPIYVIEDNGDLNVRYQVTLPSGEFALLPKERMLHIVGFGNDGLCGQPLFQVAAKAIGLGAGMDTYASKYFAGNAEQSGYITIPADLDPEAIKNLRKSMQEMNGGLDNSHRYKYLYDSVTFQPSSVKPADSQLVEARTFQIQEIARFFRIPLPKIQDYSKASYNSFEHLQTEFYTDTLMPWVTLFEQELTRKLFTDPKDRKLKVIFDERSFLRGDSAGRGSYYRIMKGLGILSTNEIRELEDYEPVEGGDEVLQPLNMGTKISGTAERD